MSWSVNIGSIAGTAIRVHITFLLLLVWIFAAGWVSGGIGDAIYSLVFVILLFACVVAHEFGHIFTARAFGVATPDVTLWPIGGVARLERIPEKPSEEFLVAIAGPLVNVAIAIVLIAVTPTHLSAEHFAAMANTNVSMIDRLAEVNLFLAAFNMIPAFPMDGGRVLRALLASRLGHVRATEIAATIGQWSAFGLGFLGLFYNPLLIFIAIFVYIAAASEAQVEALRAMSRDVPVAAAMMTEFATLTPDEHIDAAVQTLLRTSQSEFPVIDGEHRLAGMLGRAEIIRALRELGPTAPVANVMVKDVPTVEIRSRLEDAFRLLQEKAAPAVGVVDAAGRLAGLVTAGTVGEMLMVRKALPPGARLGPWTRFAGKV
jgi:Zn-dependent protease/CBS domain-containing protein